MMRRALLVGVVLALIAAPAFSRAFSRAASAQEPASEPAAGPLPIRWAFVTHGSATGHRGHARAFEPAIVAAAGGRPCETLVATGSYPDVTVWVERSRVDLALLPAVAWAAVRNDPHVRLVTATEQLVPYGTRNGYERRHYRATAVVRVGSPLHQAAQAAGVDSTDGTVPIDRLREPLAAAQVVAVDPFSASGFLAPAAALMAAGAPIERERLHFAQSHDRSLRFLAGEVPLVGRARTSAEELDRHVAFVSEDAWLRHRGRAAAMGLVRLRLTQLESTAIPGEALVASTGFLARLAVSAGRGADPDAGLELLRAALGVGEAPSDPAVEAALHGLALRGLSLPNENEYAAFVAPRLQAVYGRERVRPGDLRRSAHDLACEIAALTDREEAPKVALVLSGGGNKCAYEAGVLRELWAAGFEPDVIVGTSGGALNALATALGFNEPNADADPVAGVEHPTLLEQMWLDLEERDIIPARSALVGLTLALLGLAFLGVVTLLQTVTLHGRWRLRIDGRLVATGAASPSAPGGTDADGEPPAASSEDRPPAAAVAVLAIALVSLVGFVLAIVWAVASIGGAGWGPFGIVPTGVFVFSAMAAIRFAAFAIAARRPGDAVVAGALERIAHQLLSLKVRLAVTAIAAVALVGILVAANRASELVPTTGVRDLLTRCVGATLPADRPSSPDELSPAERTSRDAAAAGMRADLILTVTPFGGAALDDAIDDRSTLADEWLRAHYKWFPRDPAQLPRLRADTPTDRRARFLDPLDHRHMIDVATASGALFPVFGLHEIEIEGRRGRFIDGGFAHNIPIQAARLWGAELIVVVQASPDAHYGEAGSALGNLGAAINVLFDRAQRLDAPSEQGVRVFKVAPREEYGILTFERSALARRILDGRAAVAQPSLVGEVGFTELAHEVPEFR